MDAEIFPAGPDDHGIQVGVEARGVREARIERHYGALLDGAHAGIAGRLDTMEAELEREAEAEEG